MSDNSKPVFSFQTPILCVNCVPSSLEYYEKSLGFEISWAWSDEGFGKGTPTFASVCRGEATYFLCEQGQGNPGSWSSLFLNNKEELDSIFEEYKESGAKIIEAPENKCWGMCEMLVEDLDGNTFRIGYNLECED